MKSERERGEKNTSTVRCVSVFPHAHTRYSLSVLYYEVLAYYYIKNSLTYKLMILFTHTVILNI